MNLNNHFFSRIFQNEKTIQKIRVEVIDKDFDDIFRVKFLDKIDSILQESPLLFDDKSNFLKQITFNFWNIVDCYAFQKNNKNSKAEASLIDFLNASTRIIQFAIYIYNKNLEDIRETYFDVKSINVCFYKHFINIENDILINNKYLMQILKDPKNKCKLTVFIGDDDKYLPSSNSRNEIASEKNLEETFWF